MKESCCSCMGDSPRLEYPPSLLLGRNLEAKPLGLALIDDFKVVEGLGVCTICDILDTGGSLLLLWRLTEDPIKDSSSGLKVMDPTSLVELPELVFLCLLKD